MPFVSFSSPLLLRPGNLQLRSNLAGCRPAPFAASVSGRLGLSASPSLRAADPQRTFSWNWAKELFDEIARMRKDAVLWVAVIANTFFWFLGAILLLTIVLYATDILHVDEAHSSYLLAALSLGIGVGSFLAGYASGRKIEMGMILPGLTGIVLMTGALSAPGLTYSMVMGLLAALGVCAGFFVVPVNALIQNRPRPDVKGRVIGAANLLSFGGIALQPLVQYAMLRLGHPDPGRVFLISADRVHRDGVCAGAHVAGAVAQYPLLDAAAAEG